MYENLLTKAKEDEKKLDDLLRVRENAYKEFLDNSERAYRSDTVTGNDAGNIHDFYPVCNNIYVYFKYIYDNLSQCVKNV